MSELPRWAKGRSATETKDTGIDLLRDVLMDLSYQLRRELPVGHELSVRAIPGPNLSKLKTPEAHMILVF